MKNKGAVLFWVDLLNTLLMLLLIASGVILKWVLPPGSGGRHRGGGQTFATLSRHDWGELHFYISLALVVGIIAHLLLHTGWIGAALPRYLWPFSRSRRGNALTRHAAHHGG